MDHISLKKNTGCCAKSSTAQDMFWSIPDHISCWGDQEMGTAISCTCILCHNIAITLPSSSMHVLYYSTTTISLVMGVHIPMLYASYNSTSYTCMSTLCHWSLLVFSFSKCRYGEIVNINQPAEHCISSRQLQWNQGIAFSRVTGLIPRLYTASLGMSL